MARERALAGDKAAAAAEADDDDRREDGTEAAAVETTDPSSEASADAVAAADDDGDDEAPSSGDAAGQEGREGGGGGGGGVRAERSGRRAAYLSGLANVERHIEQLREDVLRLQSEHSAYVTERGAAAAERCLAAAVRHLRAHNLAIDRIDSEMGLLSIVNDLRATGADESLVRRASDYRESFPDAMAVVRRVAERFDALVRRRLHLIASAAAATSEEPAGGGVGVVATAASSGRRLRRAGGGGPATDYSASLSGALAEINRLYERLQLLLRSWERRGVDPQLLDESAASSAAVSGSAASSSVVGDTSDPVASSGAASAAAAEFYIVRLPRDAANKLWQLLVRAEACVAKDKQFVVDMEDYIRQRREEARERERTLQQEKQQQLQLLKQFALVNMMLQKNKQRLRKAEEELDSIDAEIRAREQRREAARREKQSKESAIEFLRIGIAQTRKNYSLQLKRARVARQLQELESALGGVAQELEALYQRSGATAERRREIAAELRSSQRSYDSVKGDLERLTRSIATLEPQVQEIAEQLERLEALQQVKTSPEMAENFLDRPTSVKLAPSLLQKIDRKRKRLL